MDIRKINSSDLNWIQRILTDHWGSCMVVSRGRIYHADRLEGFIAHDGGQRIGLVTYSINDIECEIVTLNSLILKKGIGSALLHEVVTAAREAECRVIRLVTTNDNRRALRFFQKRGFTVSALRPSAIEQSRKLKPEIPETGFDGIPIRDEIELEMRL
jgi:N-acetylglutamate synthase-like GNAT family acetyltransferase